MDEKERREYERAMENQMIQKDVLETARKEGQAEGRAEGRAEGILNVAANLKKLGMGLDEIATATGLSNEDIANL